MEMYTGNKSGGDFPGRFPYPYYWWESGAVMGVSTYLYTPTPQEIR